jgi:hypothetical protein
MPHIGDIQIQRPYSFALFLGGRCCLCRFTDQNIRISSGVDFYLYFRQGNLDASLSNDPPPPPARDYASRLTNRLFYSFINSPSRRGGFLLFSLPTPKFRCFLMLYSVSYPGILDSSLVLLVAGEDDIVPFQGAYICKKAYS